MVSIMSVMNRFEFNVRVVLGASVPTAMTPKIVAKSNGPGGLDALIYNSTADPIKRNTAMIAVGCSKFSMCLEARYGKRGTPASRYPPEKIFLGFGVVMISERARLASLIPRHDQLPPIRSDRSTRQTSTTYAHDAATKNDVYSSRSNTEMNGPWGGERNAPI